MAIKATATLKAAMDVTIDTSWIPFVRTDHLRIKGTLDAELGGYAVFTRQYGVDKSGIWYQDSLYFSGIKGKVKQKLIVNTDGKKAYNSNPTNEPIDFTLFKEKIIILSDVKIL